MSSLVDCISFNMQVSVLPPQPSLKGPPLPPSSSFPCNSYTMTPFFLALNTGRMLFIIVLRIRMNLVQILFYCSTRANFAHSDEQCHEIFTHIIFMIVDHLGAPFSYAEVFSQMVSILQRYTV